MQRLAASTMLALSALAASEYEFTLDYPNNLENDDVANTGDTSDSKRNFEEICIENGFQFETHEVTTEDGYILNVFRIPGLATEGAPDGTKPPILFQHGILDSAYCWIINYADVAPAFVAARAGYDVWLGNSRGNTFSRAHTEYDPDHNEKKFWDFTWKDMGDYDLPAVIDAIQTETDGKKVAYVGHSQGTTQMFTALSTNQDYFADKVPLFVALGPVTKISHTSDTLFLWASHFYDTLANTCAVLGIHELLGDNWFTSGVASLFCTNIPAFCELLSELFISQNPELDDNTRFAVYMGHEPNGTSVKSILHYTQNLKEDRFQEWSDDYKDPFAGDKKRHTALFELENITKVPVAMFTGTEDPLANLTDSRWTRDRIGDNIVHYEEIPAGHLTFMVGKDMTYFSEGVMDLLQQYHPLPASVTPIPVEQDNYDAWQNLLQ